MCVNSTGDHQLPVIVISKQPIDTSKSTKHPVFYMTNSEAWFDQELYDNWFTHEFVPSVEAYLDCAGLEKKAILFIENSPAHSLDLIVGKVKCQFIPAAKTPLVQTLDHSSLLHLKNAYRMSLLRDYVENYQSASISPQEFLKSILGQFSNTRF